MEHEHWHWQEPLTAWRGVGLYHITLVEPSRKPLLGRLVIPDNDPAKADMEVLPLGRALVNAVWDIPKSHPEIQVLHYCLMPDHLHMIWYVRHTMKKESIKTVVQGFWQGVKQIGRLYSSDNSSFTPTASRNNAKNLRSKLGDHAYYALDSIFTTMPFIRPMARYNQLQSTIRYIDMNPQRLATKRLMPGFFRVQEGIEISGRMYSGVGNIDLLNREHYAPVHVRRTMVDEAEHGDDKRLRDYMNSCVLAARQGAVMVSPFISEKEKEVLIVLLAEEHPLIFLADNGFRDYYKPQDSLFDSVAAGRVLILSPWEYDPHKHHVTRADCVAMNKMAEEIALIEQTNIN